MRKVAVCVCDYSLILWFFVDDVRREIEIRARCKGDYILAASLYCQPEPFHHCFQLSKDVTALCPQPRLTPLAR